MHNLLHYSHTKPKYKIAVNQINVMQYDTGQWHAINYDTNKLKY